VSFYEINGLDEVPENADPFNIFTHPSWLPLIELAREKTDRIVMRGVAYGSVTPDPLETISTNESVLRDGSRLITKRVQAGNRLLTTRTRQDQDVNTIWTVEPLLKDTDDLRAFLQTNPPALDGPVDTSAVIQAESTLGDTGIVLIDTPDPLCLVSSLFEMEECLIIAMTEPELFHQLLEHFASTLIPRTEAVAKALPGRLWRIYGPEMAAPPYLPPYLFREYVCRYVTPMIEAIHRHGGYARIHCHGKEKLILDDIVGMGADALDPIEPPPQGDVELKYVREKYGDRLVLFGNLEACDIENLPTDQFAEKIKRALDEGTSGNGRGFVLMPSACPYGRELPSLAMKNYEKMVEIVESL
jgi:hypothetical protein